MKNNMKNNIKILFLWATIVLGNSLSALPIARRAALQTLRKVAAPSTRIARPVARPLHTQARNRTQSLGRKVGAKAGIAAMGIGAGAIAFATAEDIRRKIIYMDDDQIKNGDYQSTDYSRGYAEEKGRQQAKLEKQMFDGTAVFLTALVSQGGPLVFKYIEKKIIGDEAPALLIDSSPNTGFFYRLMHPFSKTPKREPLDMVLLSDDGKDLLSEDPLIQKTKNVNELVRKGSKDVTHLSYLLFGPPGTGKTMRAKKIAQECDMDFGVISGASLSKFSCQEALVQIDKLFDHAKKSKNGAVIVIDEAETLFLKRAALTPGSDDHKKLNHLLALTGTPSAKHMLILTTNHKELLDNAVLDRINRHINMRLPNQAMREKVLELYINKTFFGAQHKDTTLAQQARELLSPAMIADIATKTEGASNRSLQGFVNDIFVDSKQNGIARKQIDEALEQMRNKIQPVIPIVTTPIVAEAATPAETKAIPIFSIAIPIDVPIVGV